LSIYDEYTIAYKDRSDLSDARDIERMISMGNALSAVIIMDGKVAGTWKRKIKKDSVEISLSTFKKLSKRESGYLSQACEEYGKFLELKTVIV
jgi:hypothetical protein